VQADPQALSPSTFNDASTDPSVQLDASQVSFFRQAGLDDGPHGNTAQPPILYDAVHGEDADPSGWQGSFGHGNLALHSSASVMTAEQSSSIHIPAQQISDWGALGNIPRENGFDQGSFDDISLEDTMNETTFNNIFYTDDYPV
jgi:hypothetical protein